jgi:hypothetical protein
MRRFNKISSSSALVILDILVPSRVHDVLDPDRPHEVVQDEKVGAEQEDRHAVGKVEHHLVLQLVADGDGGQDEARVGEHHGPPAQVEVLWRRGDDGHDGDKEPPQGQGPQEDGADRGKDADDLGVNHAVSVGVELVG